MDDVLTQPVNMDRFKVRLQGFGGVYVCIPGLGTEADPCTVKNPSKFWVSDIVGTYCFPLGADEKVKVNQSDGHVSVDSGDLLWIAGVLDVDNDAMPHCYYLHECLLHGKLVSLDSKDKKPMVVKNEKFCLNKPENVNLDEVSTPPTPPPIWMRHHRR